MNYSTQLPQTGPSEKSPVNLTESPASCGSKAIDDPILGIDNRADALDVLNAASAGDLTNRQHQHLCRVARTSRAIVEGFSPKQSPKIYWARKFAALTVTQLAKQAKRIERDARILVRRLRTIAPSSIFRAALEAEQKVFVQKVDALNDELIRRKGFNGSPAL